MCWKPFLPKSHEAESTAPHPCKSTQTEWKPWDLRQTCKTLLSICPQAQHPAPSPTSPWPGAGGQQRAKAAKTLQLHSVSRCDVRWSTQREAVPQTRQINEKPSANTVRPEVWKWCIGCCCSTVLHKDPENDISKQRADSHGAHITPPPTTHQSSIVHAYSNQKKTWWRITNPLNKRACMGDCGAQPSYCSRDAHLPQSQQPGPPWS